MTIADAVMILAVLAGPLIAVQLTRYLDQKKEVRERKLTIFKTLMATRATTLNPQHVEALNRIDLEFGANNKRERAVVAAWKAYLDVLNTTTLSVEQWSVKRVDLLVELLHTMARVLNYDFDKTHIKNSSYYPRGYGELELDQLAIRQGIRELLEGRRPLPMWVANWPKPDAPTNTPPTTPTAVEAGPRKLSDKR